jgi:predicted dehydrogenase
MNILIIGTGNVATANYLPVLCKHDDTNLSYFNRTRSKAEECASRFGGSVCGTLEEAFALDLDAVFVLTKETTRAEVLRSLLQHRPTRVFLEKPLVAVGGQDHVTEQDFFVAEELMNRLADAGCETAMIFNYRFFEQTLRAQRIVAERAWGAPLNVSATTNYACWSHVIDLMHVFMGPVERVNALEGSQIHRGGLGEAPDVTAALTFENGASGTLLGSWSLDFGFPLFDLTVNYEKGRVRMRGLDGELEVFAYTGNCREVYGITRDTSRWDWYKASFAKSIDAFLDSVRQSASPPIPGEWGLRELQVEAALRRSIAESRPVILDQDFPLVAGKDT